jgi:hypothetical protein
MSENRLNAALTTRVKKSTHQDFRNLALKRGLSANQYLKLLVLREIGITPVDNASQKELQEFLRGR